MACDVAVEVTLQPQSLELCLGMDVEPTESLRVRTEEQTGSGYHHGECLPWDP